MEIINDFCRTCEEKRNLTTIDSVAGLRVLLDTLLGIKDHQLFQLICWKCITRIQDFSDFREKCLKLDTTLKEMLNSTLVEVDYENEEYQIVKVEEPVLRPTETNSNAKNENHICEICNKSYVSKRNLRRHEKTAHTDALPYEFCKICDKKVSKFQMPVHTAAHVRMNEYICDFCGSCFYHKEPLRVHMQHHIKYRGFHCDKCQKQFKNISALNEHRKTHEFNRLIKCELCDKKFLTKKGLLKHKARQHEENQTVYTCEICGRTCSTAYALSCHKRQHTDERPYSCDQCDMKFRQLVSLKKHIHTHSGTRPFNCQAKGCTSGYYCSSYLKNHMLKIHGMEYQAKVRFNHDKYGLAIQTKID